jgi:hypothetical protein
VNPAANAVIVDTGAIPAYSTYQLHAIMNTTVQGNFLLRHLDAAGAILQDQEVSILANEAMTFGPYNIVLLPNEKVQVVCKAALLLSRVSCSIFWAPA